MRHGLTSPQRTSFSSSGRNPKAKWKDRVFSSCSFGREGPSVLTSRNSTDLERSKCSAYFLAMVIFAQSVLLHLAMDELTVVCVHVTPLHTPTPQLSCRANILAFKSFDGSFRTFACYASAVVGSMTVRMREIRFAGNPPCSACFWMVSLSGAT